jgi:hypothetical protein
MNDNGEHRSVWEQSPPPASNMRAEGALLLLFDGARHVLSR